MGICTYLWAKFTLPNSYLLAHFVAFFRNDNRFHFHFRPMGMCANTFLLKKWHILQQWKELCAIHLTNQRKADKSAELFEGPDNDTLRTPIGLSSKAAEKQIQQTLTWMAAVVTFFPAGNPQTTANWLQNWYLAASGWTVTFFQSILRVRCAIN